VIVSQTIQSFAQIVEVVFSGGVIAFRTDTFYGLGADPFNREAVKRIKKLKSREGTKPILIIISDQDQIERFIVERSESFESLAHRFWPGPLTLIGKAAAGLPDEITGRTGTVGVRLPDDADLRALLRACGGALTATSANSSNEDPAKTARDVERYFGSTIDLIVDGGNARVDRASTVVDVTGAEPKLVREGVIAWSEIVE